MVQYGPIIVLYTLMNNPGLVSFKREDYKKARGLYSKALKIKKG